VEPVWLEGDAAPTVVVAAAAAATIVVVAAAAVTVVVVIVFAAAAATVVLIVLLQQVSPSLLLLQLLLLLASLSSSLLQRLSAVGGEEETKTNHNEGCGSFSGRTAWASHFMGPPFVFLLPQNLYQATTSRPHPYGKGRGGCDLDSLCGTCWGRWWLSPHPSDEGRGSLPCLCTWLGGSRGVGDVDGGRRMREDVPKSTVMWLMAG